MAVYYLQLQYVQTFHDIKHFNMKPHWSEVNTVWIPKLELSWTLKRTIQKWLSSWYSVNQSHETFKEMAVTHKTHTFTNPKSWVFCFGCTLLNETTMSLQNTFSVENATLIIRCVDVWFVCDCFHALCVKPCNKIFPLSFWVPLRSIFPSLMKYCRV